MPERQHLLLLRSERWEYRLYILIDNPIPHPNILQREELLFMHIER